MVEALISGLDGLPKHAISISIELIDGKVIFDKAAVTFYF